MKEKITPKDPEFEQWCQHWKVTYPSTVHHFERHEIGGHHPVLWEHVTVEQSRGYREGI